MLIGKDATGNSVEIPSETLATAGTAILAMRGAGKSWLNAVLAEGLAKARIPFVIVDPEGEYWTLRAKFSSIVVVGGTHADIPLEPELATILAQEALEERLELVLDLSDMRRKEQLRFLFRFLSELFFQETELRIPFWVSFEEADLWVPQSGNPSCKTAVLDICQRGRKRGLGFALVSQRPATIDKTALSQAEFRFFKRFQQPHDLRAVGENLGPFADRIKSLPSLAASDALLYAPTLSSTPIQFRVASRVSPHGGATPEQVVLIKPSTTILELRKKFEKLLVKSQKEQSVVEQLQRHIQELEQELTLKEEELTKTQLAGDVADILTASGRRISTDDISVNERAIDTTPRASIIRVTLPGNEGSRLTSLIGNESAVLIGAVGVDLHSGLVTGNELANLLLNRLEPGERVVFLALKRYNKLLSVKEISRLIGFSVSKTRRIVAQLLRKGLIISAGRERRGQLYVHHWEAQSEAT